MLKTRKTILGAILCAVMALCVCVGVTGFNKVETAYAETVEQPQGAEWLVNEGDNHVWYKLTENTPTTDPATYTLTIGGEGAMPNEDDITWGFPWTDSVNITTLVIENGITSISNAFQWLGFTSVTIPDSVTAIGTWAFQGCQSLPSVVIPDSVKSIGGCAFASCSDLTKVTFDENSQLETIGESAFANSGLLEIELPASTKFIDVEAFRGCEDLTTVTILATEVPTLGEGAFIDCSANLKIKVPAKLYYKYVSEDTNVSKGWLAYKDKIEAYYTIADILPTNFPTTLENGWENEFGVHLALKDNALVCVKDDQEYVLVKDITTAVLSKDKAHYSYTNGDNIKITFLIFSDKLYKINVPSGQYFGKYFPKLIPFEEDIDLTSLDLSGGWVGKTLSEVKASFGSEVDGLTISEVSCNYGANGTVMGEDDVFVLDETYRLTFILKAPDGCYFSNENGEVTFYFDPRPYLMQVYAGKITSNAALSYAIVGAYDDLTGYGNFVNQAGSRPYNVLTIELSVKATKPSYTVTFNSDDQAKGTIDIEEIAGIVEDSTYSVNGNTLTVDGIKITATPNEGYEFDCWKIGETVVTGSGTITADTTFTAVFKEKQLTVLEVLATVDFPTVKTDIPEDAWVNENGSIVFLSSDKLAFRGKNLEEQLTLLSEIVLTAFEGNYIYNNDEVVTFIMDKDGKLISIQCSDSEYNALNGTYAAVVTITKPTADTKNFVYDGTEKTYTLATNDAYTISNNVKTEVGTYTVTVALKNKFTTHWADGTTDDLTFNFIINQKVEDVQIKDENNQVVENPVVSIIGAENGIAPDAVFVVKVINIEKSEDTDAVETLLKDSDKIAKNEKIYGLYDAKLVVNKVEIQPNGNITVKMLVPEELRDKEFKLYHIHNGNEVIEISYSDIDADGFITFTTDKLSEFAFVGEDSSKNTGLSAGAIIGIVLGSLVGIVLIVYVLGYFFLYRKGKLEDKKIEVIYKFLPKDK